MELRVGQSTEPLFQPAGRHGKAPPQEDQGLPAPELSMGDCPAEIKHLQKVKEKWTQLLKRNGVEREEENRTQVRKVCKNKR